MNRYSCTLVERFEEKCIPEPNSGCWIWIAAIDHRGYGRISYNDRNFRAPRVSWIIYRGVPTKGLHILHRCDNRLCVNPDHLFLGTNRDNSLDKAKKGRVPHAKLQSTDIPQIRLMRSRGTTFSRIAATYGVNRKSVEAIFNGKSWQHVS